MALRIVKRSCHWRVKFAAFVWTLGVSVMLGVPLSQAVTVRSPSKNSSNDLLSARTGAFLSKTVSKKSKSSGTSNVTNTATTTVISPNSVDCTVGASMHVGLTNSFSLQLKKLAEYEQACNSAIVARSSFFTAIPTTAAEASEYASDVASQLREYSKFGIKPLIFLEPTSSTGLIDLTKIQSGSFDGALTSYFASLKAAGVTDEMMGIWVPLPEANLPVWSSLSPSVFTACITKLAGFQKKYFPASQTGLLLDTVSYSAPDDWSNGRVVSLLPYVINIPAGLIDSFGLQGFPWSPPANEAGPDNGTPSNYLRVDLAIEAARTLKINNIWFNTGTFGAKYTNQPAQTITVSPERRLALLDGVVSQAKIAKAQSFSVSVHLFAEDKSNVEEATDWSYWPSGQFASLSATYVFKSFAGKLQAADIPLWLFDTD